MQSLTPTVSTVVVSGWFRERGMVEGFFSLQPEEHIPKHDAMFVDMLCMLFLPHHSGFSSMRRRASKSA